MVARPSASAQSQPLLFTPITFRSVTGRNRIMLSPMCEYSAKEGMPNEWHMVHLGARAVGGSGWVFTEATAVEPRGRITPHCTGIWNDAQRDAWARIVAFVAQQGGVPGMQLAHAGRKGSARAPWEGRKPLARDEGGWETIAPSPIPFEPGQPAPAEMTVRHIGEVKSAFAAAARRAREAGFRVIEIHAAHGYLIHEFLSPLSNHRTDSYGGSIENRARFLLETLDAVRKEWPANLPMFVRVSSTDWVSGGWDLPQTVALAKMLKARGDVDLIDCSSGGNDPRQQVPTAPGYQVPFAEAVRKEAGIATGAVGLIRDAALAEDVLTKGHADLVVMGRRLLDDPYWPLRAAKALGGSHTWPLQYQRADMD